MDLRPRRSRRPALWLVPPVGSDAGRHALVGTGSLRVGRCPSSDIVLAHPSVSREHAVLEWIESIEGGSWRIGDRGSASGTWVNDVALPAGSTLPLRPGDRVRFGPVRFDLAGAPTDEAATIVLGAGASAPDDVITPVAPASLEASHLDAVLAAGAAIHAATDERGVAEAAVQAIADASGFSDIAFLHATPEPGAPGDGAPVVWRTAAGHRPAVGRAVLVRARNGPVSIMAPADAGDMRGTMIRHRLARVVCVPVALGDRLFGFLWLSDAGRPRGATEPVAAMARAIASTAALALANLERLRTTERLEAEHRAMFDGTMQALIATIDAKDPYTRGHSARVAEFAHLVATRAGLAAADCERARLCGLVHDIGKIGVPEAVLRKPGKLTDAEFATIAEHPVTGHDILRGIPQMADVLPGVLHHHERFDGRGYPHRLAGEQIPMIGRVIAVADAIDAMTTSRTYRSARPMAAAVEEVVRSAGSHFDPMLARAVGSMDLRELQAIVGLHVFGPGLPGGATLDAAWAAARMVAIPAGADQPGAMRRTA